MATPSSSKVEEGSSAWPGVDALLDGVTVDNFPFTRKVQFLDASATVEDAFKAIAEYGVSSLPVRQGDGWVGFVDIADLVAHVVELYKSVVAAGEEPRNFASLRALLSEKTRLVSKPVEACVNLSKKNPFLPVAPGTPLRDVLVTLGTKRADGASVHRVPVVDADGNIVKIISQSAAIQFLFSHLEELGEAGSATLEKLGLARKAVVTVRSDDSCLRGFQLMSENGLSGLGVVSPDGRVVCSMSAADVRYMVNLDKFEVVGMDVITFVSRCRLMDTASMARTMAPMVAVHPASTIAHVVAKLAATRVHRLYVVEASMPVGVVSLKDILALLLLTERRAASAEATDTVMSP